jgi:predicted aspartyl protease
MRRQSKIVVLGNEFDHGFSLARRALPVELTRLWLACLGGRSHARSVLKRTLFAGLAWLCAAAAHAECRAAPDADTYAFADAAAGPTQNDRAGRVVAPISVNGQGPFRFIVDTGANRSVLSARLAERLGLAPSAEGQVHSVYGVTPAPLVRAQTLTYDTLTLPTGDMPILSGPVLAGEHGLLGVDGMAGRRLLLDFRRGCIEIQPSRGATRLRGFGWTTIRGQMRFGHLVVVRGRAAGMTVNVLIDTGSDTSLANTALRRAIDTRRGRSTTFADRGNTAGGAIVLDRALILPRISIGEMEAQDVTAFVGDYHIFSVWQMLDEPTVLLGMDVLTRADALAIDYGRGTVSFRIMPVGGRE